MKEVKSYVLILKQGDYDDRAIRGITPEGGKILMSVLSGDPPKFVEVKERMIATNGISQLVPIY